MTSALRQESDEADLASLAAEAGLSYVSGEVPGYRRVRRGSGFSYLTPDGEVVADDIREWITSLAIPPAWQDVWIATDDLSHILATGYDDAGRKQYIYHAIWEEIRDEVKFDRLGPFSKGLVDLRRSVEGDLRCTGLSREKVVALAVAVLDRTLIRVGNRRYAEENDAYGLTTLRGDHVEVNGRHVVLDFEGKAGSGHQLVFADQRLARLISQCQELSGQTLFSYETTNGAAAVSSTDVNAYLARVMKGRFTAKDFRTWGATTTVARRLTSGDGADDNTANGAKKPKAQLLEAIDIAAEKLGNTREVCRDSYVHPAIPEAFMDGTLERTWKRSRAGKWVDRTESTVRRVLDEVSSSQKGSA